VRQRSHNAVGLGPPRVGDDEDLHAPGIIARNRDGSMNPTVMFP
jgi:hypothetical protein